MIWRLTMLMVSAAAVLAADYLLPGHVAPRHYDLRVLYDVDSASNFSLYAVVDILIKVVEPTSRIVLHIQDLEVVNESITVKGPLDPKVTNVQTNDSLNFLTLTLDDPLQRDEEYRLTIPFKGNLKPGLDGAYISTYMDTNTKKKEYLLTTQFEAIHARKAFPCFDEPMYKATFKIVLGHDRDYVAVSNMPLLNSSSENVLESYWPWSEIKDTFKKDLSQFVFDQFETSVPMSTYLVAYVISKFAYVESPAGLSDTTFKIWARKDAINQTSYAAVTGPKVLSHFEKFFNVSFPLPKQDMFAIPDFSAGAMENWGLITYRETALLYDPEQSSFVNKERVAEVIAHELAHQWFGNLVTMKWWSDLWLNEGFATFVASVGVHAVEPTWRADKNYAVDGILSVLNLDALHSSHPVSVPLDNPKRINEIFDEISYRKGATLIRMMMMFLGEDVFRKALHNYLTKYSYKNAAQDDLWQELTEVSDQYGGLTRNVSVKTIMDTWTTQTGYPILTVSRNYADRSVTVSQKRYLNLGTKSTTAVSWWIPLSVMCESEVGKKPDPVQWLAADEGVKTEHEFDHGAKSNEWILFNYDMIALYRVNYDHRNWQLLINTLTSDKMSNVPVLGRVQLLSDAFALAWNNQLEYSTALQLANYLQREDEYLPLSTGLRALGKIEGIFKRTPDYGAFQKFVRKLITDQYHRAGGLSIKKMINTDDLNSVKMQSMTSSWACRMKVPGCEENAIELFQSWMKEEDPDVNNPIPLDLRRTVYCVALSRGSVVEWRFAVARMRRANVASARDSLLSALGCTRDVWVLAQYLEWTITEGSEIRRQDAGRVISTIASSSVGFYVAREFLYTRVQDIFNAFNGQGRRMGLMYKTLLTQFTTQRELDEFLKWYEKNKEYLEDAQLAITQAIEAAKVNIDWLERNKDIVVEKLRLFSAEHHENSRRTIAVQMPAPWRGRPNYIHSIFAIHNISSALSNPHKQQQGVYDGEI